MKERSQKKAGTRKGGGRRRQGRRKGGELIQHVIQASIATLDCTLKAQYDWLIVT